MSALFCTYVSCVCAARHNFAQYPGTWHRPISMSTFPLANGTAIRFPHIDDQKTSKRSNKQLVPVYNPNYSPQAFIDSPLSTLTITACMPRRDGNSNEGNGAVCVATPQSYVFPISPLFGSHVTVTISNCGNGPNDDCRRT